MDEAFERAFLALQPDFEKQRPLAPYFSPEELLLRAPRPGGAAHFIILLPHPGGHEAFTVEIGWSKHGEQPKLTVRPTPGDPRRLLGARQDMVTRLAYLDDDVPEFWYLERQSSGLSAEEVLQQIIASTEPLTPEVANERVAGPVKAAIDAIRATGLPFLSEYSTRAL